jgi:3-oxoadipate enol-lactonase
MCLGDTSGVAVNRNDSAAFEFVNVDGAALAMERAGAGANVVLIHAGISNRGLWRPQWPRLTERFDVLRYDLRGFGDSSLPPGDFSHAADLTALLTDQKIERPALVGVSLGAAVAAEFALENRNEVSALVLCSAMFGVTEWSEKLRSSVVAAESAADAGDIDRAVDFELSIWVDGPNRLPSDVDPGIREAVREMNREIWLAERTGEPGGAAIPPQIPLNMRLAELTMPVLLLAGAEDQPDALRSLGALAAGIPHAERHIFRSAAHLPNLERPEEFNEVLIDFLERNAE